MTTGKDGVVIANLQLSSTGSPFWRTASANSQRDNKRPETPERKVIGASYSHADILKLDNL
jgi:TBC1 domain family member 2